MVKKRRGGRNNIVSAVKRAKVKRSKTLEKILCRQQALFAKSECLEEAFFMIDHSIDAHDRFVHYTTLPRLAQKVESKRWWLTRSDSDCLNDVQEAKKFGNPELLCRMYQSSFSYGTGAESAAMWGLYCHGDPLGVMISLSGVAMREWFEEIRFKKSEVCLEYTKATAKHGRHVKLAKKQIEFADARDVIYAATDFANNSVRLKNRKTRSHILRWFDTRTKKIENLAQEINVKKFTGWIKDAEWWQENESRIAVRVKNVDGELPLNISVNIPDSVLKSMIVTLSPWLKAEQYDEISAKIRTLVRGLHDGTVPSHIVSPSVLTGALESWRIRYSGYAKGGLS